MAQERNPASRPTLKTIAAETGLAITTVSRALSDAPDIGASTKKLVRSVADRVGYRPNRAGVRLRTGRSNVVSILMSQERNLTGHTARLIHSFAGELRDTGFHLIVTPTFDDEDPLNQLRYLYETGSADAVVINKIQPNDPRIAFLSEHNIPFVTHGRSDMGVAHGWYDFDNERFAELAVQLLAQRGRKHVLVIAPPMDQNYSQHIMAGAQSAADTFGMRCTRLENATSDSSLEVVEAAVTKARSQTPFDAVICASVSAVIAAVAAIENAGLHIGSDVDLAAKEPFPFLRRFREPIISIPENADAAGAFLAKAALSAIRRPSDPPMTWLEVPELNIDDQPAFHHD